MTQANVIWLAGLLEGEGWFGERTGEDRSPRPMISLKMCDRDVVERVANLFGDKAVTPLKPAAVNHKKQFVTRISGVEAIEIMKQTLPYMGKRRTAAIEILLWLYDGVPVGKQPRCICGRCSLCRNREASRRYKERQKVA